MTFSISFLSVDAFAGRCMWNARIKRNVNRYYFVQSRIILFNLRWLSWNSTIQTHNIISILKRAEPSRTLCTEFKLQRATVHSDESSHMIMCTRTHAPKHSRAFRTTNIRRKKNIYAILTICCCFFFISWISFQSILELCCCFFPSILSLWLFYHFICVFYEPCMVNNSVPFAEKNIIMSN